jgi:hypothetical protein
MNKKILHLNLKGTCSTMLGNLNKKLLQRTTFNFKLVQPIYVKVKNFDSKRLPILEIHNKKLMD